MFIRKLAALASLATVGLLSLGAGAASATSTAIRTDAPSALLTGATTITNGGSDSSTMAFAGFGSFHCAQTTFEATLASNTGAASVTGTLNQLTFTSCVDTIPVITFTSCHLDASLGLSGIHIVADNSPAAGANGTVQVTDPRVKCLISGGGGHAGCYYTFTSATAIGNVFNANSRIVFPAITVHHVTGTGDQGSLCPGLSSLNTTLTDVRQVGTNRTITVTTT
jgi:hypothetical protein